MITQSRLKELFDYNPYTGDFIRKIGVKGAAAGSLAGCKTLNGYITLTVDYEANLAHRLAYLFVYGYIPKFVDHINGIRSDNRIGNLRPATVQENSRNSKGRNGKSGIRNVYHHKPNNTWNVKITIDGKPKSFGYYKDLELAELVAISAREKYFGEFANHD